MSEAEEPTESSTVSRPLRDAVTAFVAGLVLPGAGHVFLGRRRRGVAFFAIVMTCLLTGVSLDGNLHHVMQGQPLTILATVGSMGIGLPYFALRYGLAYQGDVVGAGYEYGSAFILTAGLMNILLLLDVLDLARGDKD